MMKKGWKIFWIVSACIAGVGLLLAVTGGVMGATFGSVQAAVWKYENHAEQTVERLEDKIDRYDDNWDSDDYDSDDYDFDSAAPDVSQTGRSALANDVKVHMAEVSELDIDVCYLQVEIQEGTGEEIVLYTENVPEEIAEELMVFQENRELEVGIRNEQNWKHVMKNRGEAGRLIVQIPNKCQLNKMTLSIGAGVLNADHIQAKELDVEVGAGVAEITQFHVNSIEIEVGAGEISVAGSASAGVGIDCGIGKVDYQAAGSEQDYSYEIECGVGVVRVGNEEYSGIINGKKIMNGGALMEIDCGAGEVNVGFTGV